MGRLLARPVLRGRDTEIGIVRQRLHEARAGHGSVVIIEGRPGSGKSRFLAEVRTIAEASGYTTAAGAGFPGSETIPLAPLVAAVLDPLEPPAEEPVPDLCGLADDPMCSWINRMADQLRQRSLDRPLLLCL